MQLVISTRAIVNAMTAAKATFPKPTPSLAQVSAHVDALEAAEVDTKKRTVGSVAARDGKRRVVVKDRAALRAYVQQVMDAADDIGLALAIAAHAGMNVRKASERVKQELAAKPAGVTGWVLLVARALAKRASYDWQYSLDKVTWISAPSTLQVKTVVKGLTPGALVHFRFRAVTKTGVGDWSQIVSMIVV